MIENTVKTPWKDYMGEVPMHLDYFDGTMSRMVGNTAEKYPEGIAFDFMGKSTTYRELMKHNSINCSSVFSNKLNTMARTVFH